MKILSRPSKEELEQLYLVEKHNSVEIGDMFGVSDRTIREWMQKYGIQLLGPSHLRKGKPATWNKGRIRSAEAKEKNRQAHLGRPAWNKGQGSDSFDCEVCGKEVTDKPYRRKRVCSEECRDLLASLSRGERHWNYDSTLTCNQRQRQWADTRDWRDAVLERDSRTCVACGATRGRFVAHHLHPWADHPGLRLDVDNGVCLCTSCHTRFHRSCRQREISPDTFQRWLTKLRGQFCATD